MRNFVEPVCAARPEAQDTPLEVWFQGEARVGRKGR